MNNSSKWHKINKKKIINKTNTAIKTKNKTTKIKNSRKMTYKKLN